MWQGHYLDQALFALPNVGNVFSILLFRDLIENLSYFPLHVVVIRDNVMHHWLGNLGEIKSVRESGRFKKISIHNVYMAVIYHTSVARILSCHKQHLFDLQNNHATFTAFGLKWKRSVLSLKFETMALKPQAKRAVFILFSIPCAGCMSLNCLQLWVGEMTLHWPCPCHRAAQPLSCLCHVESYSCK